MWIAATFLSCSLLIILAIKLVLIVKELNALNAQFKLIKEANSSIIHHLKEHDEIIKQNSDFADRYIEQLHTKIIEIEVTLQNIVNKT